MFLGSREVPDVWKMDMSQILDSSSSDDEDEEEEKGTKDGNQDMTAEEQTASSRAAEVQAQVESAMSH